MAEDGQKKPGRLRGVHTRQDERASGSVHSDPSPNTQPDAIAEPDQAAPYGANKCPHLGGRASPRVVPRGIVPGGNSPFEQATDTIVKLKSPFPFNGEG